MIYKALEEAKIFCDKLFERIGERYVDITVNSRGVRVYLSPKSGSSVINFYVDIYEKGLIYNEGIREDIDIAFGSWWVNPKTFKEEIGGSAQTFEEMWDKLLEAYKGEI